MTSESGDKSQYVVINSYLKLLVVTSRRVGKQQHTYNIHTMYTVKRFASTVKKNMLEPS